MVKLGDFNLRQEPAPGSPEQKKWVVGHGQSRRSHLLKASFLPTGRDANFLVLFAGFCGRLTAKNMSPNTVLWIYIILLLVGGLIGYLKAGSKVSLHTSAVCAALLVLAAIPGIFMPGFRRNLADLIMAALLVVFAVRLTKTRKFMPSGLMLAVTITALALRHFLS